MPNQKGVFVVMSCDSIPTRRDAIKLTEEINTAIKKYMTQSRYYPALLKYGRMMTQEIINPYCRHGFAILGCPTCVEKKNGT